MRVPARIVECPSAHVNSQRFSDPCGLSQDQARTGLPGIEAALA